MNLKRCTWALLIGVFVVALIGSFEWSPVDASRLGQTVPTRTPTPKPEPTQSSTSVAVALAPTPAPTPALLPVAGGPNVTVWNWLIVGGLVLITLGAGVWLARRRV